MGILTTLIIVVNVGTEAHGWRPVDRVFGQRPKSLLWESQSVQGPAIEQFRDDLVDDPRRIAIATIYLRNNQRLPALLAGLRRIRFRHPREFRIRKKE